MVFNIFKRRKKQEDIIDNQDYEEQEEYIDTYNIGWHYSIGKDELELAKVSNEDYNSHFYIVGASGTGKSKFLEFLIRQDIDKGNGFCIIDPHGDLIEAVKEYLAIKYNNLDDILLIDPINNTVAFNPLEPLDNISSAEIASELIEAFKHIWHESWGARMEDLLRNSFIALIESNNTLADLPRLLLEDGFRDEVLDKIKHPIAIRYFQRYNGLSQKLKEEWIESTLNKVNAFLSDDRIRRMLSFKQSSFSFRELMDDKKIILIKLDKGRLKEHADLLGSLLLTKIKVSSFSRSDIKQEDRVPFYLYIDEFQNFANQAFIDILAEARKYGLYLRLAHQNLSQIPDELQDSILTNCLLQFYFRVSRKDAERLAKEAFEVTGLRVKSANISYEHIDYDYYSWQEEWEQYYQELQQLPNRLFYAKHKRTGDILLFITPTIMNANELIGLDEDEFYEFLDKLEFGKRYVREVQEQIVEEQVKESKDKSVTLEEIIAILEPLEKAILYAIGIGNYKVSDIYEHTNKQLREQGYSTKHYNEFKKALYRLAKLPPEGKGLIEFVKQGKSLCYWLSKWGEIAFAEKFNMPTDKAINELSNANINSKAIAIKLIKEWLEPKGYSIKLEDEIYTNLNESNKGYTDIVAYKGDKELRIEIEYRSNKEQVEKNILKNLRYNNILHIVASDEQSKRKAIQVGLKLLFRLRKDKPDNNYILKIAKIEELERSKYEHWDEIRL